MTAVNEVCFGLIPEVFVTIKNSGPYKKAVKKQHKEISLMENFLMGKIDDKQLLR